MMENTSVKKPWSPWLILLLVMGLTLAALGWLLVQVPIWKNQGTDCEGAAELGRSECIQEARTPEAPQLCADTYEAALAVCEAD